MKFWRATTRLLCLSGITCFYYLRCLVGGLFVLRSRGHALKWRNQNLGSWARATAGIMGLTVNVQNRPPSAPFLLISNHLSYVDVVVLASQMHCTFIAKSEVAGWPIIGLLCSAVDTIFIDRNRKRDVLRAMKTAETAFERGLGVVLFPEGTSTGETTPQPFKSSLLEFAARQRLPVHYASVSYVVPHGERPAAESVCWWGSMTFHDHLFRLLQLAEFEAKLTFGPQPVIDEDRHVLAAKLWSAVSAQLKPLEVES
jgi:1-acyl-sn-glycerol-3-phosphate acyltransferase